MRAGLIAGAALALAAPAWAAPAWAAEAPRPGVTDARIQTIDYDPDQVVQLRGVLGYQLMIEFGPDERIENVSIGDSLGWQVTPNRKASLLFLKPVDAKAVTNMTVVTDRRRYAFDLSVVSKARREATPYILRFLYAEPAPVMLEPPPPEGPPVIANAAYAIAGDAATAPIRVFDDGQMTYFEFGPDTATPAIFAVAGKQESLVNYVVRGPYLVVDQLSPAFILRNGAAAATVTNQVGTAR